VDTSEIEQAMVEAAHGFGERVARTFGDSRSRIHIEDAKTFFSLQQRKYDVIVAEPSNPWVSGVASLFSEEFYRTVPSYLKPDGVFVQWLQLYEFNNELAHSVLKALTSTFADVAIYNTDNGNVLIVAKPHGALGRPDFSRVLTGRLGAEVATVGLRSSSDFLVRKSGSMPIIEAVLAQSATPANSDYFPFLDLRAGRARYREQNATLFHTWSVAPLPVLEMLGMDPFDFAAVRAEATFHRTTLISQARTLHAAFVDDERVANAELGAAVTLVKLLGRSCSTAPNEELLLSSLHTIAQWSLALLNPADAASLVTNAIPEDCWAGASPRLKTWLALYRAVAARDASAMADAGAAALAQADIDDAQLYYALTAAMLGNLVNRRPDRTLELWRDRPELFQTAEATPDVELMILMATKRLADGVLLSQGPLTR
jgi:hypothetical protein